MRWSKKDEGRQTTAQQILQKRRGLQGRILVPVEGQGSHCRVCALIASDTRWKSTFGGSPLGTEWSSATGGGRYKWRNPNGVLVSQSQ